MTAPTPTLTIEYFLSLKLKDQRAYLCELRATDPASALRLVQSLWTQSDALSRKTWLNTFSIGLNMADEPFLESALDDRGRRVRGAAAYLLATLNGSRLLQRFTDQAVNHLDYLIHKRPNTPDQIHITFPEAYTPAMKRDGIAEKPYPPTANAPTSWLFQMIARIPLQTWTQRWNKTPQQLINAAFSTSDYTQYLITAWLNATYIYKDPDWAEALLAYNFEDIVPITPTYLLNLVRPERREQIIENNLSDHPGLLNTQGTPIYMLWHLEQPWSPHFSKFILDRLAHYANPTTPEDPKISSAMHVIANALSPTIYPEAQSRLGPPTPIHLYLAGPITTLLTTLKSRYEQPDKHPS